MERIQAEILVLGFSIRDIYIKEKVYIIAEPVFVGAVLNVSNPVVHLNNHYRVRVLLWYFSDRRERLKLIRSQSEFYLTGKKIS